MSRPFRKPAYSPCSIICHGLCEVKIAEHLCSRLRVKIRPFSKNCGKSSLEVQNLPFQLRGVPGMKDRVDFLKCYKLEKREFEAFLSQHKIFALMDRDSADDATWKAYKDGSLFANLWFAPFVVPIYFEPDLDVVSSMAGYPIDKKGHKPDQVEKHLNADKTYLRDLAAIENATNLKSLLDYLKLRGFII